MSDLERAAAALLELTECRCASNGWGLYLVAHRRHAPDCVTDYRADVLELMAAAGLPAPADDAGSTPGG